MIRSPQIGDILYPAYTPAQAGKVVSVTLDPTYGLHTVTIRTLKGKEVTTRSYRSYSDLVEDHRRKYEHHKKILYQLLGP